MGRLPSVRIARTHQPWAQRVSASVKMSQAPRAIYRVLLVGAFPSPGREVFGGVVTACRLLIESSFASRFELHCIDSTQRSHPAPPIYARVLPAVKRLWTFLRAIQSLRPDCVLIFTSSGWGLIEKGGMARLARLLGCPVLLFPRGGGVLQSFDSSRVTRLIARFAYRSPDVLLCQGEQWQSFLHTRIGRSLPDLPIVPNWTATDSLLAVGARRRYVDGSGRELPLKLLYVGWIEREKGVYELIEACRGLLRDRQVTLTLVGDGGARTEVERLAAEAEFVACVRCTGWLSGPELEHEYANADLFVLPSWAEGMPNCLIEAMACGLPSIATAVGNIPSVLQDGVTGLVVPPRRPDTLGAKLSLLVSDSQLRERVGRAAHRYADANFGVEAAVVRLSRVVERVSRSREPHPSRVV